MKKVSGMRILFLLLLVTALTWLDISGKRSASPKPDADAFINHANQMTPTATSRKLKVVTRVLQEEEEEVVSNSGSPKERDLGRAKLEDYGPVDPVPSSKASIRPGPIEHGTPLMPFIPNPSPPPGHP